MEHEIAPGTKFLNGFLSVMVTVLVGVLAAIVISFLLWTVGIF